MKPGAKTNALIMACAAGLLAQQSMNSVLNYIAGHGELFDRLVASYGAAAALVFVVLAVIKAIPQPVEEEKKVGSDGPVK